MVIVSMGREPALMILCKDTMILWSSSSLGYGSTTSASSLLGQSTPLGNVNYVSVYKHSSIIPYPHAVLEVAVLRMHV